MRRRSATTWSAATSASRPSRNWLAGSPGSMPQPNPAPRSPLAVPSRRSPENARENFEQSAAQVGVTLSKSTLDRLKLRTEAALAHLRDIIEDRARRGIPRDTHGDLRLDHVYWFPERNPPGDWIVVDCIEFDERFRYADPIADIAFLAMELTLEGRGDLAESFVDAYLRASGDEEGRSLLPFYMAYRAAVRGKVEGMKLAQS